MAKSQRNAPAGVATHNDRGMWPQYYRLLDHDKLIGVLAIPSGHDFSEVIHMVQHANEECTHRKLPGQCARIERTDIKEWLLWHPVQT